MDNTAVFEVSLEPNDARRLASLCGQFDQHLRLIEQRLDVHIRNRGNQFSIEGETDIARVAMRVVEDLYDQTRRKSDLTADEVHLRLQSSQVEESAANDSSPHSAVSIRTKKETI